MKVLDLRCQYDHAFEGWFAREQDYQDQLQRGLLQCPVCGSSAVRKMLSAPRINLGARDAQEAAPAATVPDVPDAQQPPVPDIAHLQATLRQLARKALAQAEDVGQRFADEARRMHRGETPERSIKGQASAAEAEQLLDEGIPVLALPPASTETLH
ncbi:DUF1178 family protein [Simplicispira lacusdiani]|uniref:DUF1178 family protein n=1 Tax=Simplicispira lacusdiani TaxID=2213010 RepID=UPI000E768719|nr:DUF1178 family protein [Simplicispira lacusdiani]